MPKEAKASLGKARQLVHLTGKVNFPSSRLAGGLALQDRRKRFNQRFLKTAPFPQNFFDVITAQDCLDHSNDPLTTLKHCSSLAKSGAVIAIKVHNFSCLLAKLSGPKFYAFIPPSHLCYFNLPTLKLMLEKCGITYTSHFYNTQKLKLSTAISRAYRSSPHGAAAILFNFVKKYPIFNWPIYKNFHDVITVFGKKI